MKKFASIFLVMIGCFLLASCGKKEISTLQPAGEVAKEQFNLMGISAAIMVFVILVVLFLFVFVLVKFRRKSNDEHIPKQVEGNHKLEILWTVIPIILLVVLTVPTVLYTYKLADTAAADKKNSKALVINVRANLYWWEFEYPKEGIVTSQELVVPTDKKIYFTLKSSDVKHAFWIPSAGGKIDTNIENNNRFYLTFDEEKAVEADRVFYGKCAELCGPSHALMDFKVRAIPQAEYEQWLQEMKQTAPTEAASQEETNTETNEIIKKGQAVFEKSCGGCHAVTAVDNRPAAARTAPNLAMFGDHIMIAGVLVNSEDNFKKWVVNPEKIKESNKMTGKYNPLSDDELSAVYQFLMKNKSTVPSLANSDYRDQLFNQTDNAQTTHSSDHTIDYSAGGKP